MQRLLTVNPPPIPDLREQFGPYEVLERIGVGGMATVHRALERGIEGVERYVALKRLLPHLAESETFIRSFVHEARLASRLTHPHIVQMHELGRVGSTYFISMEHIEGVDLRQILRQTRLVGPPPIEVTLAILDQVCDALDYAHTRRSDNGSPLDLVHRDVSPSNVIVSHSGHVKVIDFGIAKAATQQYKTKTGRIKGKMAYLSPESLTGIQLDRRSDLFSAGVIAHELLCARPLFATKSDYETLLRVQNAKIIAPSEVNPQCPRELDKIVLRALTRDRNLRWQSARQIRAAIDRMRDWYHLRADEKSVRKWLEWAFASERTDPWAATGSSSGGESSNGEPPTLEEDDEILELVWEGRSKLTQSAVILDDVPDFSDCADEPATPRKPRRRATTMAPIWAVATLDFLDEDVVVVKPVADQDLAPTLSPTLTPTTQDAIAMAPRMQARLGRRTIAAVAAVSLLAAAAAGVMMLRSGDDTTPAPPSATLRVEVEPPDATIHIDGEISHTASRIDTALAVGEHHVEIRHPDFNPWRSAISTTDGERQTIRVVLERRPDDIANVTVKSSPEGLPVLVDGKPTGEMTPATIQLAPGHHVMSIALTRSALWEHAFDAIADTNYEFQPTIPKSRVWRHRRRAAGQPSTPRSTVNTARTEPLGDESLPPSKDDDQAVQAPAEPTIDFDTGIDTRTDMSAKPAPPAPGRRNLPVL